MLLVHTDQGSLLVDCGMYQGRRAESSERNRTLPAPAARADAAILTHAHIDHSGSLPTLVKGGFRGMIHTTPATRDVAALMLRDSARIQAADAGWLNRKFADDPGFTPIEPVYDEDDVAVTLARMIGVPYGVCFEPLRGVTARFRNAGHILGSAHVHLTVREGDRVTRISVSGDLGRHGLPILPDPDPPEAPADFVVMESTYGNRTHPPVDEAHEKLATLVNETVARGGRLIVPAFALGRTQELVYFLHELRLAGRIPPIPIYVDSPLATGVTAVYQLHPECYDRSTRRFFDERGDPFAFDGLTYVGSAEDSMALNDLTEPIVIISAAGMAESGRVLHHLRRGIEDPRNCVLIVGFQAQHTLGRRLVERRPQVRILGIERDVNARVEVIDALSAHADRGGLLQYAQAFGPAVKRFFLVHGEPDQQGPLAQALTEAGRTVEIPRRGQIVDLDAS